MVFGLQISNIHSIFFPENQLARIHQKAVLRSELTNFHWNQIKFCQLLQNLYVATKQSIKWDKKCARSWQSINFHCRNTKNLKPLKVAKWYVFLFFLWWIFVIPHSSLKKWKQHQEHQLLTDCLDPWGSACQRCVGGRAQRGKSSEPTLVI